MLAIGAVLALLALLIAIYSATRPQQLILWISVVLLSILELVRSGSSFVK